MAAFIQSQRAIVLSVCDGPGGNLFALLSIKYPEFSSSVEVYENSRPRLLKRNPAGARVGLDVSNMLVARRIDNRQRPGISITESGVQVFRIRIVAHLVRIRTKLQTINELEV